MKVLKFGGTSLGNAARIAKVADIITTTAKQDSTGIVLSAVGGVTNYLATSIKDSIDGANTANIVTEFIGLHRQIAADLQLDIANLLTDIETKYSSSLQGISLIKECPPKVYCQVLSFGEALSLQIMLLLLQKKGIAVECLMAKDFIKTTGNPTEARPLLKEIKDRFAPFIAKKANNCLLMSGFVAADMAGNINLLGRNGSDYSASIMAYALEATICEFWTDVNGIYTADPNKIPDAKLITNMSYAEAMELSFYGGKILHPKTIGVLKNADIPALVKNTFQPNSNGTLISNKTQPGVVRSISVMDNIASINICGAGLQGNLGIATNVFNVVAKSDTSIVLISQASSEHSIFFCIQEADVDRVCDALHEHFALELESGILDAIEVTRSQAIICIVGDNMKHRYGIAGKFFLSLAYAGVNIIGIAQGSSESCISAVIASKDITKALQSTHQEFFASKQQINLYIVGVGLVGTELINQVKTQYSQLLQDGIELKVCALATSTKFYHDNQGIELTNWQAKLNATKVASGIEALLEQAALDHPVTGILVDCTSSDDVAKKYLVAFKHKLHVVTASKKANSLDQAYFYTLREQADRHKRLFLYETNVGAGLPVIENLQGLVKSGDELLEFAGILSGSLSFIFGALDDGIPFSKAVRLACDKGFTEPDPRDDLSGMDVARKLLILAREAGLNYELKDIKIDPILPQEFDASGSVAEFLQNLTKLDAHFAKKAAAKDKVLRFAGEIKQQTCSIGIKLVDSADPLYAIKNGENAFAFLTKRYNPIPLVVRGYGAGAAVTASGVFADILKIATRSIA